MGNYKWNTNNESNEPFVVVLMISRNKDNKDIKEFKERRWAFVAHRNASLIKTRFDTFVNEGVSGEFCRLYVTLNSRKMENVRKELLHRLIDKEDFNFEYIEPTIAAIAAKKENAAEHQWFFDFDSTNTDDVAEFEADVFRYMDYGNSVKIHQTPNGYAVIVQHGFDTRELMKNWSELATLKRDDLICIDWRKKK